MKAETELKRATVRRIKTDERTGTSKPIEMHFGRAVCRKKPEKTPACFFLTITVTKH